MSLFVMSDQYPRFFSALRQTGHEVIPSDLISAFPPPEQRHADMQALRIKDRLFILKEAAGLRKKLAKAAPIIAESEAGSKYPDNILLNFLFLNNRLYGRIDRLDPAVKRFCEEEGIELRKISQGYAKCSTLVVTETAAITADKGIFSALKDDGADVLLISQGNIELKGCDYGFIGGASGKTDDNTVVFFGNIAEHPDHDEIIKFITAQGLDIKILAPEQKLTDIGGIVKVLT